MQKKLVTMKG